MKSQAFAAREAKRGRKQGRIMQMREESVPGRIIRLPRIAAGYKGAQSMLPWPQAVNIPQALHVGIVSGLL